MQNIVILVQVLGGRTSGGSGLHGPDIRELFARRYSREIRARFSACSTQYKFQYLRQTFKSCVMSCHVMSSSFRYTYESILLYCTLVPFQKHVYDRSPPYTNTGSNIRIWKCWVHTAARRARVSLRVHREEDATRREE